MFEFLFGAKRDEIRASALIKYLNNKDVFGVREGFFTDQPRHTQLKLNMAVVDVKITCRDGRIHIALQGYSDNNYEDHVPAQVGRVRAQIHSYLRGSHAAKWRHRVVGI